MPAGRPLKFHDPEKFSNQIDAYFLKCEQEEDVPTITGLAVFLDTSRETLNEYSERPEFVDAIKRAKDRCEAFIEKYALLNKINTTFSIFNLKNNYGWREKSEHGFTDKDGKDIYPTPILDITKQKPGSVSQVAEESQG